MPEKLDVQLSIAARYPESGLIVCDGVHFDGEAILAFGRDVVRLGGCPLAEHGVGRNPVKQLLLRELYGEDGVAAMRAVKHALDPGHKLAPGVIFA